MKRPNIEDYVFPDEKSDGSTVGELNTEEYLNALETYIYHLEKS